ncbi:MAG: PrpF domain-containing protein, partial [Alphaproteobacteria bacterium]|nr:PrpF domain-containing protein [Alphaproteobacteria bacterium]
MSQRAIAAVFMRGGTSKGLFFHARDLPPESHVRDRILLAAMG